MPEQKLKLRMMLKKEVKKIAILTNIREIIQKLLVIMKKHIGEENKISHYQLFIKVYGLHPEDVSDLQEWVMWEFIKRALHSMRQRTKCFVISKQIPTGRFSRGGIWNYWVANNWDDFSVYQNNIERNVLAMRRMVKKCEKSVREKWSEQVWEYK